MKKQKDLVKYSGLSFEEFLLDDFFVASNLCPTEESVLFWEQFEQDNKECLDHYLAAKKCLRDINKDLLKPHQVATMWERIKTSNRPVKSKRYQYLYIGLTAACIAMLFIIKNLYHRDIRNVLFQS
ncbi:MAG: hypothetical protein LBU57_07950 [Dysgonamonadaceae bacterium]|nr:hypothetical protein [Dysgonamonadaceae bacterium]